MLIDGSHNVIVRNLFFRLPVRGPNCANPQTPTDTKGCGLPLYIRGGARDVWIDHNDFDRCGEKCITVWNGRDRDAAGRALAPDLITISDNRLTNSYFGIAIGSGALLAPNELPQRMRITIYGNVFSNIFRRTPRAAANSEVHEFNNLIRHWGRPGAACNGTGYGFGASASGGAQIFLENNVFEPWPGAQSCKLAGETDEYDPVEGYHRGTGEIRGSGNLLLSGAQIEQTQAQQVFNPADRGRPDTYYPYQLRPVAGLAEQLEREAGVEGYPRAPLD
jgi:pectate lyase